MRHGDALNLLILQRVSSPAMIDFCMGRIRRSKLDLSEDGIGLIKVRTEKPALTKVF
jgi:hypothetical protein